MIYKNYIFSLLLRIFLLFTALAVMAFALVERNYLVLGIAAVSSAIITYNLYRFTVKRIQAVDDFFESVKYRDFSRWFVEGKGPKDMQMLHKGFNEVNRTIKEINNEKEAQYVYLQKILEMVDIGIIAYNLETGSLLWINDSFRETLDFPSFKNISFVERKRPEVFETIFETYHPEAESVNINVNKEKMKVLVSDTVFHIKDQSFRIIVIQNIEDTLNQNEAEAWKKLLSVMTHEIMNSIAPISSLADSLHTQVVNYKADPARRPLEVEDWDSGISSIKKRSEGLMKFAKTYRSLNKITHLNLNSIQVKDLFANIENLMRPSLQARKIEVQFEIASPDLVIEIDIYLIEQVLINLILNAADACVQKPNPRINISAKRTLEGKTILRVQDNGTGIPAEIQDSIFVPFFTTKKNGSGIGLSLCKQIMMLHKGKIQINSEEGKGSIITLIF